MKKFDVVEEPDKKKKDESFGTIFANFAGNTTAHGFSQIITSSHFLLKCLWISVLIACQVGLYTQMYPLIQKYNQKPIKTRVYLREETDQRFPVIAICNSNMISVDKLSELKNLEEFRGAHDLLDQLKGDNKINKNSFIKPPRKLTEEDADFDEEAEDRQTYDLENDILSIIGDIAINRGRNIFEYGHSFDMIRDCKWKKLYNCRDTKFWTNIWHWRYGNCFVFNMLKDVENASYAKVTGVGPDYGLSIDVDIQQSKYVENTLTETAGVILYIGEQGQIIDPHKQGHSLSPGYAHYVSVSKKIVKKVDPFRNNSCRTHKQHDLGNRSFSQRIIQKYSTEICKDICLATMQIESCKCSNYWLPSLDSMRTCNLDDDFNCSNPLHQKSIDGRLACLKECTPPCEDVKYEMRTSAQIFPTQAMKSENKPEANEVNLMQINIFFKNLETTVFEDEAYYQIENLLGDIGGQMGLWSGFSTFTVFEVLIFLFQWLLLLTYRLMHQILPPTRVQCKDNNISS